MNRPGSPLAATLVVVAASVLSGGALAQPAQPPPAPAQPAKPAQPAAAPNPQAPPAETPAKEAPAEAAPTKKPAAPAPKQEPGTAPNPPRPPPPQLPPPDAEAWSRHVDVAVLGGVVEYLASHDATKRRSPIRYEPGPALGVQIGWDIIPALPQPTGFVPGLGIGATFQDSIHGLSIPKNALNVASVTGGPLHTYFFGLRLFGDVAFSPTVHGWISGGASWGRFEVPRLLASDSTGPFYIRSRADSLTLFPFGIGGAWEVIPGRFSLLLDVTASIPAGQDGNASVLGQTVDGTGKIRDLPGMPLLDFAFAESLGVALLF